MSDGFLAGTVRTKINRGESRTVSFSGMSIKELKKILSNRVAAYNDISKLFAPIYFVLFPTGISVDFEDDFETGTTFFASNKACFIIPPTFLPRTEPLI